MRKIKQRYYLCPIAGLCLIAYFGYHLVNGERGLIKYRKLQNDVQLAKVVRNKTANQKDVLENRVKLLRPESIDPDMLEESARRILNMGHDGDLVIIDGGLEE
ncbi:MAG: septum formation initiator family protein [Alphaproteobacteria bacterium]|nr:septum formation initiator family protein [Alphaproteobacteria bacterium]